MFRRFIVTAVALSCVGAIACSKSSGKKGPAVAEGGGIKITADELKARIDEQSPMIRQSFQTTERKKQFLEQLVRFELLAKAAEKEGLRDDPEVQYTFKKVLVSKYYQKFFQGGGDASKAVPDADIQKYYDDHKDEFHRPARVHAYHVFFAATGADRAKKAAEAKKALAKLLADEKANANAIQTLAREKTDDTATKVSGGDLGFRSQEEYAKAYGPELASMVFSLNENTTAPTLLEEAKGFHIVRVAQKQPEFNRSLEDAKSQISARLASQKKAQDFDALIAKLKNDADIKVNDAELEKIQVSPAAPGQGGMPGMMGPHGGAGPHPMPVVTPNPSPAAGKAAAPAGPAPAR